MFVMKKDGMRVPLKIWSQEGTIESQCLDQMKEVCSLPFVKFASLMPDAHLGIGASIGSVVATDGVVIPNLIGVDQGCGMCAVKTSLTELDTETLKKIMGEIRKAVPVGFNHQKEKQNENLMPKFNGHMSDMEKDYPIVSQQYQSALNQIGTLGGGNHFIEIQKGSDGYIWIMIHSGSRNLGLKVATHHAKLAAELNSKWHSGINKELAFLPVDSEEGQTFLAETQYSVDFALANRKLMMNRVCDIFDKIYYEVGYLQTEGVCGLTFGPMINIAHNYVAQENHFGQNVWVHRKGATLARKDTIGIIPGSMGSKSYIVKGRGNPESLTSCSHGAGRVLSRSKAKQELNLEEEQKKMEGIVHGLRNISNLDEAPGSYKDISKVMKNQEDLVEILVCLSPIANIKG